jgi:membrane fusion protein, macrolide-specific efflux system
MVDTGTLKTQDPVDLTAELPLDDENVPPPERPSAWRRYRWLIVGVAVVVVAAAVALPLWLTSGSSTPTGLSITTVTVPVTGGNTMQQFVSSSGTIEPANQANLNFAVSGTVTAVDVKAGQTVTAGQALATVDTTVLNEQLSAAEASLTSAQDRLSSDEASGATTSTLDSDEASLTSAESSLSTAQTNLNDASLTSTIAGTVASVSLTVGQQVTGTGSGGGGTGSNGSGASGSGDSGASSSDDTGSSGSSSGQIVVIGTDSYIVNTSVDDTQIGQITDGDQVDITPTGSSSTAATAAATIYGTVGSISLVGSQTSDVTTFPVVVNVTGNPSGLYAGGSADVNIIVKQLNDVTEVPTGAISYSSSGQATVTEVVNGAHVVKDVTVGAAQSGETQITSGISPGAKVLERQITFKAPTGGGGLFPGGAGGGGGFPGGAGGGGFFSRVGSGGGGGGAFPIGG